MNDSIIKLKAQYILNSLFEKKAEIIKCLQNIETYKTAKSELDKSVSCLQNINKQEKYLLKGNFLNLCVFLPLNQPLYSLVLFAIIPGCMFKKIFCRPPVLLQKIYLKLYNILNLITFNIFLKIVSRKDFIHQDVLMADVIIYTGKYENAIEIKKCINSNKIFIFQGSGTNPIIVSKNAIINNELIEKVLEAQTYNSGQDCMAPSAILISKNNFNEFKKKLIEKVCTLSVGSCKDVNTDIAPMIEKSSIDAISHFLEDNHDTILYGGQIDFENNLIYPTILEFKSVYDLPYQSKFAPIFCLYSYSNEKEISEFLERPECKENEAYISVFGNIHSLFGSAIIINNDILDSIDNGYTEFGGFGIRSGFISYNDVISTKPILISKELASYHKTNGIILPIGDLENPKYETSIVLSNINLSQKSILEIGCGTIPHAKILAPYCKNYVAIDKDLNKVNNAISTNTLKHLSLKIMNAKNIEFKDQTFDGVFMFHCLHEVAIEEQGAIIKEIYRVLKENGYLFIIDATSEYESDIQECFNLIHENFFDYKHLYSVKHSEWVIQEYIKRGFYQEIKNEVHKMYFSFPNISALGDCLLNSFKYEYHWDDISKKKLINIIQKRYGDSINGLEFEEIINFRIMQKLM